MHRVEKKGNSFLVDEKTFQSLSSKGFGQKKSKGVFELTDHEVLFLLEKGTVELFSAGKKISKNELLKKKGFDLKSYLVYRDLRKKGYQVKSALKYGFAFRVYDKGIKEGDDHSLWLVEPVDEKDKVLIRELAGKNRISHSTGKRVLLAVVDADGDVTYLENSWRRM